MRRVDAVRERSLSSVAAHVTIERRVAADCKHLRCAAMRSSCSLNDRSSPLATAAASLGVAADAAIAAVVAAVVAAARRR